MSLSLPSEPVNVFFSLAPQDENLFEELRKHLMPLKRQGIIDLRYDSLISAGSDFIDAIRSFISTADIIVLLISSDFLASDQCIEVEMQYVLKQRASRASHVITVLLRPTGWLSYPQYILLPSNGKAVSIWNNQDSALAEVARGIYRVIEEFARWLAGTTTPVKPPQFPISTLPYRHNLFFTDRDEALQILHRGFTDQQTTQTLVQTLHGLGGMGKTLLAMEYAHRYQKEYQATLWLNAESRKLLSAQLLSLARLLGIPAQDERNERERIAAIQRWLRRHDRWLLVLDNLEDSHLLKLLIPAQSRGHVLVITSFQTIEDAVNTISVSPLSTEDGALLLLKRAGMLNNASEEDDLQAREIVKEVEGYPLAIDQAGAYVKETRQTLTEYLNYYRQQRAKLLKIRGRLAIDHPASVAATLSLTLKKLARSDSSALELLYLLAFLYPEVLPNEMLQHGTAFLEGPLRAFSTNPLALDAAIDTLIKFSLVQRHAEATTLNMPRIIQSVIRQHLKKKQQRQFAQQAVRLLNAIFPAISFKTWKACERYIPQAQHCAGLIQDFNLTLKEGPLLLERLGSYYAQHGCYDEAESYLTQALHLQERLRQREPTDTAQILNSLGLLYQQQARYQLAEAYHKRALKLRKQVLSPEHPKIAESLHNLALLYGDQGEYQRAEQFYLYVIALQERATGSNHANVAKSLNNLGLIYFHQGRYAQAEATYQRALAIYRHCLPANHPDLMHPLDGLGALAEAQGKYLQAQERYQEAFAICKQALGEIHPEAAHCINKLADIAEIKGNYQEAESHYLRAISIGEQALGTDHPDVALFLNNLAFLVHRQGQYQRAEELYRRALNIYEQVLGADHPDFASVLNNLGKLFINMGDEERAEKLLRQAMIIYEKRLPPTHPDIALALSDLAELLGKQHRYIEAEPLYERAIAILQSQTTPHPDLTFVQDRYASLQEHRNKK